MPDTIHLCQAFFSQINPNLPLIILLKNPISDFMKLVFAVWSFGVV